MNSPEDTSLFEQLTRTRCAFTQSAFSAARLGTHRPVTERVRSCCIPFSIRSGIAVAGHDVVDARPGCPVLRPRCWLDSAVTSTDKVGFMTENSGPAIDRSIYVMPMFVNFVVSDFSAAETIYGAAGFVTLATIPGPGGVPALVHLRRERNQDILMTQGAATRGSVSVSFAAGNVDFGEVVERLRSSGAEVTGPVDTPWFTTDVTFTDGDGNTVTLTAPRVVDQAAAREWASDQIMGDFEVPEAATAVGNER